MKSASRTLVHALMAVAIVAGCSPGDGPSASASLTPSPTLTPAPAASPTANSADGERYLLAGIRPDAAVDCVPVRERLPPGAVATVECAPNTEVVDRFRVTLFSSTGAVLAYYLTDMAAHSVTLNTGNCSEGTGESTYYPGPDDASVPFRHGCFVAGVAHYRAIVESETVEGAVHVYVAIAGKAPNVSDQLQAFAWLGNQDVPGAPTLWSTPP